MKYRSSQCSTLASRLQTTFLLCIVCDVSQGMFRVVGRSADLATRRALHTHISSQQPQNRGCCEEAYGAASNVRVFQKIYCENCRYLVTVFFLNYEKKIRLCRDSNSQPSVLHTHIFSQQPQNRGCCEEAYGAASNVRVFRKIYCECCRYL